MWRSKECGEVDHNSGPAILEFHSAEDDSKRFTDQDFGGNRFSLLRAKVQGAEKGPEAHQKS